jgi:hypothetical protein
MRRLIVTDEPLGEREALTGRSSRYQPSYCPTRIVILPRQWPQGRAQSLLRPAAQHSLRCMLEQVLLDLKALVYEFKLCKSILVIPWGCSAPPVGQTMDLPFMINNRFPGPPRCPALFSWSRQLEWGIGKEWFGSGVAEIRSTRQRLSQTCAALDYRPPKH